MLQKVVPKLFTIVIIHLIRKLNNIQRIKSLDLPLDLKERILIKYTDSLCIKNEVKHYIPYLRHFRPTTVFFKERSKILILSFTDFRSRFISGRSEHTFLGAMMPNTETSNFVYHVDNYSNESDYRLCAKKLLSKGLHIFQKFNHCDPQRIIIYFDNTETHVIHTSLETLGLETIILSLVTPPEVHFISMCGLTSPNVQRIPPAKISFMFGQERPPFEFQKYIIYYVNSYNSNTKTKTLKLLTKLLCKYTWDHSLGKLPSMVINLKNLMLMDEICDYEMSTIHGMDLNNLV